MTVNELRHVHQARPFQAFVLRVADGREYRVSHPESMSFSQTGRTIAVATPDDAHDVLNVLLITAIHRAAPQTGNGQNGQ